MANKKRKLGIALVGLGEYATDQLIPALRETQHCYLAGLVSGDPQKREKWRKECGLEDKDLFGYEDFDEISKHPDIDIVYIVLPNSMHAEYSIRAAGAGKHVICEKPMAMNTAECRQIIDAVQQAGVRFSMGYRLHFDPFNQEMKRLGQEQVLGPVKRLVLLDSMEVGDKNQWRLDAELAGGGPLMNNGVYCIQAAIYITGMLPVAVNARFAPVTNPEKFKEVEEGIEWAMYFDQGITATCESSYSKNQNLMRAETEDGWFELEPAYEYEGLKGRTSKGDMNFEPVNQQAKQMDDFAIAILENRDTPVPAEMGLRDVKIMTAIYESARSQKRVELNLHEYEHLPES